MPPGRRDGDPKRDLERVTPAIAGERVALRPLAESDRSRVREMLAHPEVARWWLGTRGLDGTVTELFSPDENDAMFAIEHDGQVVGVIQYSEEPDQDYRSAGIDIL